MATNFEQLHCWQSCYNLKRYLKEKVITTFPKAERFELHSQTLRAALSSTANIAEGWERYHYKESINFMRFARGSLAEILDHSIEARDCNYINPEHLNEIRTQIDTSMKLINGYIKYLKTQNQKT